MLFSHHNAVVRLKILRACVQILLQHVCLKTTDFMMYKHLSEIKKRFKKVVFKNIQPVNFVIVCCAYRHLNLILNLNILKFRNASVSALKAGTLLSLSGIKERNCMEVK